MTILFYIFNYMFQSVNRLAMNTRQIVSGNHSRKTAAFVRVSPQILPCVRA